MNKIKVAFIMFSDIRTGRGTEQTILNYCKYFDSNKFEVIVLHTNYLLTQRLPDDSLKEIEKYAELRTFKIFEYPFAFLRKAPIINFLFYLFREHILKPAVKRGSDGATFHEAEKCDILYFFSNSFHAYFKKSGNIFIGTNHTNFPKTIEYVSKLELNLTNAHLINRRLDAYHLFPGRKSYTDKLGGKYSFVLENGVDTEEFNPPLQEREGKTKFLFVGQLTQAKGFETLLKAWDALQDKEEMELHVIGAGVLGKKIINREREGIKYYGVIDERTLKKIYQESDIFVYPTESDTFGLVVAQALSSGLHVVTSEALRENYESFVERGYMQCVSNGSKHVAQLMQNAHTNIAELRKRAHSIHKHTVETLDWKRITESLFTEFEKIYNKGLSNSDLSDVKDANILEGKNQDVINESERIEN